MEGQEMSKRPEMLDWYYLMMEADEFSIRTGMGLASVWGYIHKRDFPRAVETLRECLEREGSRVARGISESKRDRFQADRYHFREEHFPIVNRRRGGIRD
jgi:hypothetical protein